MKKFGTRAKVLDFGCGQGAFLKSLKNEGAQQLTGFDFVVYPELNSLAGVDIVDDLDLLVAKGEKFDVIRMNHVIEHLHNVDKIMQQLSRLLTPRGIIIGQTPNPRHYTAKLFNTFWGPLHYPYHTTLFSTVGMGIAANRWNLKLQTTTSCLLTSGWALSWENLIKVMMRSKTEGRISIYTALIFLSLPLAALDKLISRRASANYDFKLKLTVINEKI